jgi:hypothetical protein
MPLTADGRAHFEVLQLEPARALVLGALFDAGSEAQAPFASARPEHYWHVTWAFLLEPEADGCTRVRARARAAWSPDGAAHARWMRPVHTLMEKTQLHNLRARVEGSLPRDDRRDVLEGLGGALRIGWELITPFARTRHTYWGIDATAAAGKFPGDDLVPDPVWSWTHAIEVAAPASAVWPWLAQIGAKRGGFYSYQWLENLVGCDVHNAETIHPEWEAKLGDELHVHPSAPPLRIAALERGRWYVAHGAPDAAARAAGESWVAVSWLFAVEPLGAERCRVISRIARLTRTTSPRACRTGRACCAPSASRWTGACCSAFASAPSARTGRLASRCERKPTSRAVTREAGQAWKMLSRRLPTPHSSLRSSRFVSGEPPE